MKDQQIKITPGQRLASAQLAADRAIHPPTPARNAPPPPSWGSVEVIKSAHQVAERAYRLDALHIAASILAATIPPRGDLRSAVPTGQLADETCELAELLIPYIKDGHR